MYAYTAALWSTNLTTRLQWAIPWHASCDRWLGKRRAKRWQKRNLSAPCREWRGFSGQVYNPWVVDRDRLLCIHTHCFDAKITLVMCTTKWEFESKKLHGLVLGAMSRANPSKVFSSRKWASKPWDGYFVSLKAFMFMTFRDNLDRYSILQWLFTPKNHFEWMEIPTTTTTGVCCRSLLGSHRSWGAPVVEEFRLEVVSEERGGGKHWTIRGR